MWDENFEFLLNYYNYDNGIDLPAEPDELRFPYRAICANIAWCMMNKERFWEYYNKSEYWRIKLMTAARQFAAKYYIYGNKDEELLDILRDKVVDNLSKRFILSPHKLESRLDISTVYNITYQAKEGIY